MKKPVLLMMVLGSLGLSQIYASDQPRGTLVELHSCELYAGGCTVSSEATLGGRYLLRAWNFSGGKFNGTDLTGLQVAVLEAGKENLASDKVGTEQGVVYLPSRASAAQREALMNWVKQALPSAKSDKLQSRVVNIQFSRERENCSLSAGDFISVKTVPLGSCSFGSCGEELWYAPRSSTSVFTVAVNSASRVTEPLLKLKWNDAGKRSVFVGRFGDSELAKNTYVTSDDFCSSAGF
ncbi:MAG TPA: DUF1326 domain-containing protein [Candidatus Eisenbacteria bacterium]|nr:DUF1326 domain-containing protein [Candidatus Eisenbacteria bacterium]